MATIYRFKRLRKRDLTPLAIRDIEILIEQLTGKPTPSGLKKRLLRAVESEQTRIYVAWEGPRKDKDRMIVAMLTLVVSYAARRAFGHIEDVVTHDEYLRQGIAKELLFKAIRKARKLRLRELALTSREERVEANLFYQKYGFTRVETNKYKFIL